MTRCPPIFPQCSFFELGTKTVQQRSQPNLGQTHSCVRKCWISSIQTQKIKYGHLSFRLTKQCKLSAELPSTSKKRTARKLFLTKTRINCAWRIVLWTGFSDPSFYPFIQLQTWRTIAASTRAQDKGLITYLSLFSSSSASLSVCLSLERTREGHRQSDEHWNRFKGNVGETSERRGGAHMGFSERIDTARTELNSPPSLPLPSHPPSSSPILCPLCVL